VSSLEHIHPEFRHVTALSDSERIHFLQEPRWIEYPAAKTVMDTLKGLLDAPSRPRMPNLLLVAEPFNGKTTIVRRFYDTFGRAGSNATSSPAKPVVLAESPPRANEKELYIALLERFYVPYRTTDSTAKLRYQVVHLCRACSVRMLVIDEFHSLLEGTPRQQREVMNAIKLLCNELALPIIGVGTRDAVRALHTDPQHASRFDVLTLPLWKLNADFQSLLAGFESVLPLKKASRLFEPQSATLLHALSGGNIGDLHRLLSECAKEAIKTGEERIDMKIIEGKRKWKRPSNGIRELPL